jgi:hypothetical protein
MPETNSLRNEWRSPTGGDTLLFADIFAPSRSDKSGLSGGSPEAPASGNPT